MLALRPVLLGSVNASEMLENEMIVPRELRFDDKTGSCEPPGFLLGWGWGGLRWRVGKLGLGWVGGDVKGLSFSCAQGCGFLTPTLTYSNRDTESQRGRGHWGRSKS